MNLATTPGHDCPGLIEAAKRVVHSMTCSLSPLRGMIAPASLKQGAALKFLPIAGSPLRGMIAPASLKQEEYARDYDREGDPLRGMIAPASLKPGGGGAPPAPRSTTPGHDCPGLIEATTDSRHAPGA